MQILAFAAARRSALEDPGGVTTEGFPMTSCHVESFPAQLTLPLVLAVHARVGGEYEMRRYLIARAPTGERVGLLELAWQWPDPLGAAAKYRVFAPQLPMAAYVPGLYTVGLYSDPDAPAPEFWFPLPFLSAN